MKKRIGAKINTFMGLLLVVFLIVAVINIKNFNRIYYEVDDLNNIYMELQEERANLIYDYDNLKNYANLIALLPLPDATDGMASGTEALIEEYNGDLDTIRALIAQTGNDELSTTFEAYAESMNAVADVLNTIATMYLANGQTEDLMYVALSINDLVDAIETCEFAYEDALDAAQQATIAKTVQIENSSYYANIIAICLFVLFFIINVIAVQKMIARPAANASKQLGEIIDKLANDEGDLTERIPVKSEDEIGQLVGGVNGFMDKLQSIMQQLHEQSNSLHESANSIYSHVNDSNDNATSVSAVMEELAASMQLVSETVEKLASNSESVVTAANDMASSANDGADIVGEIKDRARTIREETLESQEETKRLIEDIKQSLEASIEESRSVEKIEELTGDILDISSQTNLLALNASIEAARAGEAGKGFAVVADEIRVLAENSKDTANNIQEISEAVTAAVRKLSNDANQMVQFVNETILAELEKFVGVADQYHADAENIGQVMDKFAAGSKSLESTMTDISNGIEDITASITESAQGVTSAAESTEAFVNAQANIQEEVEGNREIANSLSDEVNKFKKIYNDQEDAPVETE